MKKGIETLDFLIGIIIGILILIPLFYGVTAIASLFFGTSQPCIDDAAKSSIDNFVNEINLVNENSAAITFGKGKCIFVVFGNTKMPGVAPTEEMFQKNAVCICEFDEYQNSCTTNKYCRELNATAINIIGFDKNYAESKKDYSILMIYYKKDGNNLVISNSSFTGFSGGSFGGAGAGRSF